MIQNDPENFSLVLTRFRILNVLRNFSFNSPLIHFFSSFVDFISFVKGLGVDRPVGFWLLYCSIVLLNAISDFELSIHGTTLIGHNISLLIELYWATKSYYVGCFEPVNSTTFLDLSSFIILLGNCWFNPIVKIKYGYS